jgi:hypothetical protein
MPHFQEEWDISCPNTYTWKEFRNEFRTRFIDLENREELLVSIVMVDDKRSDLMFTMSTERRLHLNVIVRPKNVKVYVMLLCVKY